MTRTRMGAVIGLAVLAVALAGCGGSDDDASGTTTETTTTSETTTDTTATSGTTLTASVGPGFEISLTGADGAAVSTLSAGDYTIEVDDQSDIHNFHLTGPGRRRDDRRRRHRDRHVDGDPGGGLVPLPVRPAREHDERRLRGHG